MQGHDITAETLDVGDKVRDGAGQLGDDEIQAFLELRRRMRQTRGERKDDCDNGDSNSGNPVVQPRG